VLAARIRLVPLLAMCALAGLPAQASAATSAGATQLLPDLRMLRLSGFHDSRVGGRRLLRFDTIIVNVGDGPFVVKGRRACTSTTACPTMTARQRIATDTGRTRLLPSSGVMRYAVDGHDHWHIHRFESYELIPLDGGRPDAPLRGAKVGYCFFDNVPKRLHLEGAPQRRVHEESGCGTKASLTTKVGLSVGWGDLYPWHFGGQYIDITGVPPGDYRVCVTTDPKDRFVEKNDVNNQAWQDIRIRRRGAAESIRLDRAGRTPCGGGSPSAEAARVAAADYPDLVPIRADPRVDAFCRIEPRTAG
jgi:hypothetical protein